MQIRIKKGYDLPVCGTPQQEIKTTINTASVAVTGFDYTGMKPAMHVREGDTVKKGQLLFTDKKRAGVPHTAPAAGTVKAINRGPKRVFQSLEITADSNDYITFPVYKPEEVSGLDRDTVKKQLLDSGQWTALRTRPFDRTPFPDAQPHSMFINCMDTAPLAPDPGLIINEKADYFIAGVRVIQKLTAGLTYVCRAQGTVLPKLPDKAEEVAFSGPHPAGLAGTHIHFLDPVSLHKSVWYIDYQEVIAVGALFLTGQLYTERVI
ncbi:MAG TPA: NADH:ubiquinone reductase (Na(+)-transporting) subunit A, partial [Spirochaetota bacterium]|nr:NADH:ubiquinone reductase (Na(+)-transporting) subunit A [Spirochaetota bacterium]